MIGGIPHNGKGPAMVEIPEFIHACSQFGDGYLFPPEARDAMLKGEVKRLKVFSMVRGPQGELIEQERIVDFEKGETL